MGGEAARSLSHDELVKLVLRLQRRVAELERENERLR